MSEHIRTEEVHDWIDGLLPPAERRRVEAHVASCAVCTAELERWGGLVAALRDLPREARPGRDLWADIERRLGARSEEPGAGGRPVQVLPLPVRSPAVPPTPRRVTLTFPQLWAAGVALALASGSLVWVAAGGAGVDTRAALDTPDRVPANVEARPVRAAGVEYDRAVDELSALLEAGRELLAPETVAAIERSLATMDAAIAEAERALAADPASPVLNRLLLNHRQTKLRILRQATSGLLPRT